MYADPEPWLASWQIGWNLSRIQSPYHPQKHIFKKRHEKSFEMLVWNISKSLWARNAISFNDSRWIGIWTRFGLGMVTGFLTDLMEFVKNPVTVQPWKNIFKKFMKNPPKCWSGIFLTPSGYEMRAVWSSGTQNISIGADHWINWCWHDEIQWAPRSTLRKWGGTGQNLDFPRTCSGYPIVVETPKLSISFD